MIQKKICMLGAFAVGKTSLVSRFVRSIFSDKYHTHRRREGGQEDGRGGRASRSISSSGTSTARTSSRRSGPRTCAAPPATSSSWTGRAARRSTRRSSSRAAPRKTIGKVPFVLMVNKADLAEKWEVDDAALEELRRARLAGLQDEREDRSRRRGGLPDPRPQDDGPFDLTPRRRLTPPAASATLPGPLFSSVAQRQSIRLLTGGL